MSGMKGLFILLALLTGTYYVTLNKVVMTQLNALQEFYSNADKYAASVVAEPNKNIQTPESLQVLMHPTQQ